jgi:hypothetical protein
MKKYGSKVGASAQVSVYDTREMSLFTISDICKGWDNVYMTSIRSLIPEPKSRYDLRRKLRQMGLFFVSGRCRCRRPIQDWDYNHSLYTTWWDTTALFFPVSQPRAVQVEVRDITMLSERTLCRQSTQDDGIENRYLSDR